MSYETFLMDKPQSYRRKLTKNKVGEEVGGRSYTRFIVKQLEKHGGKMTKAELYSAVWRNYHHTFSPDDLREIRTGLPKWKNQVAWALVSLRKEKIAAKYGKDVVLLSACSKKLVALVTKKQKQHFRKRCPQCRKCVLMTVSLCRCGFEFAAPNLKNEKVPV